MSDRRIVGIAPLLDNLKKELDKECDHPTAVCSDEAIADEIDNLEALPVIDPKEMLSALWKNTKTDPPKEEDAGQRGMVTVWYKGAETALPMLWWMVEESADKYPYWMPMPEPPKMEGFCNG